MHDVLIIGGGNIGEMIADLLGRATTSQSPVRDDLIRSAVIYSPRRGYVDFTRDPLLRALDVIADDATTLGLAPPSSHETLTG